jgi:phosphoribosylformylglycinamidine (FGAM) synthase-like amidotransferase family enzyme
MKRQRWRGTVTFTEPIELPVAHGEGKFLTADTADLDRLEQQGQVVLRYTDPSGRPTLEYPANPAGSSRGIAGACDPTGRIFGLMPHPERYIESWQHPRWTRRPTGGATRGDGLRIFESAVRSLQT